MEQLLAPISVGELYDKISILEIKMEKITNMEKLANVEKELMLLRNVAKDYPISETNMRKLKTVNNALWLIEDDIRLCEKDQNFSQKFVQLARSVYFTNDERSQIKKDINLAAGSNVVEEKSYESYS